MRQVLFLAVLLALGACASMGEPSPPPNAVEATRTLENGDVVSEYRVQGQLTMVRVAPKRGPVYYLVDSNGLAYPLVGPDVAANLGFADVDPPVVPDPWVELFDRGVNLSVSDALCPPVRASGKPCE